MLKKKFRASLVFCSGKKRALRVNNSIGICNPDFAMLFLLLVLHFLTFNISRLNLGVFFNTSVVAPYQLRSTSALASYFIF